MTACSDLSIDRQLHFRYGPELPFEDKFIVEMLISTAGNTVYFEKKINGVFGGVLDALADIWDAVVGAFEAAAKAVGEAVNFLIHWIMEIVNKTINAALDRIRAGLENIRQSLVNALANSFNEFKATGTNSKETLSAITDIIFGDLFLIAIVIEGAILIIGTLITPFVGAFNALISIIVSLLIIAIIGSEFAATTNGYGSLSMNNIDDFVVDLLIPQNADSNKQIENTINSADGGHVLTFKNWLALLASVTSFTIGVFFRRCEPCCGYLRNILCDNIVSNTLAKN